jgi:hypothetical protein
MSDELINLAALAAACTAASIAYGAAGRALDFALLRRSGATAEEWLAEDDARLKLRACRKAYVDGLRKELAGAHEFNQRVSGSWRRS